MSATYLHLPAGCKLPAGEAKSPYKAVIVLDQATQEEWQAEVSDWLVRSGCLYMMAWGPNSSSWDDSVDWANWEANFGEIPDEKFVMTTWHEAEPLSETFWFAEQVATHPTMPLSRTIIIDITPVGREAEMLKAYSEAQKQT